MKREVSFGLACLFSVVFASACSSSSSTTGDTGGSDASTKSDSSTTKTDSGTTGNGGGGNTGTDSGTGGGNTGTDSSTGGGGDDDASTGGGTDDSQCASAGDAQKCGDCCYNNHQSGYQVILDATLKCACPTICASACGATACAATPKQPDQACIDCLNGSLDADGGGCNAAAGKACQADTDCTGFVTCQNACPAQ